MTTKNNHRDLIAIFIETLVLLFFSTNIVSNAKIKSSLNQKSTNSAVLDILKRSNGTEMSNYAISKCSELRKSIYVVDTRLMYEHSVESRISESQAVNMLVFARLSTAAFSPRINNLLRKGNQERKNQASLK
jgi:hypothetical protein